MLLMAAPRRPPEQPIDLNTATMTELMQLPRVGPRTAERIQAFRREQGPFRRPEELMNIKGIGEKTFRRLRRHILVAGAPAPLDPAGAGAADAADGAAPADPAADARGCPRCRRSRRPGP